MKQLLLILVLFFSTLSFAQKPDDTGWLFIKHKNIPTDTQAHLLGGYLIGGASSLYFKELTDSPFWGVVLGTVFTGGVLGSIKEFTDEEYSWNDIGWQSFGALVGATFTITWSGNVDKKRQIEKLEKLIEQDNGQN